MKPNFEALMELPEAERNIRYINAVSFAGVYLPALADRLTDALKAIPAGTSFEVLIRIKEALRFAQMAADDVAQAINGKTGRH